MAQKKNFPLISPAAWEHPADRAALAAFSSLPFAGDMIRRTLGSTTEHSLRFAALANSARVTDAQFAGLHALLVEAATILDQKPLPELYVRLDPAPDIRTLGVERPFIVVSSGALDLWDQDEMLCILGHEIGHILSGHAVYKTLLALFIQASSIVAGSLPLGAAALMAFQVALKEWDRKSELSADRASLLVAQDAPVVFRALMKSAAGKNIAQMDINEFFRQARDYETGGEAMDSVYKLLDVLGETHPFPIIRMTALQDWERAGAYATIMRGEYSRRGTEGERDAGRDFEGARVSYKEEFSESADPLAQAASKVMDALGTMFGSVGASGSEKASGASGGGSASSPPSIEEVMDQIFGKKPKD